MVSSKLAKQIDTRYNYMMHVTQITNTFGKCREPTSNISVAKSLRSRSESHSLTLIGTFDLTSLMAISFVDI